MSLHWSLVGRTISPVNFRKLLRRQKIIKISIRKLYILLITDFHGRVSFDYLFFPLPNIAEQLRHDLFYSVMEFDSEFCFAWNIHNVADLRQTMSRLNAEIEQFQQKLRQLEKLRAFQIMIETQQLLDPRVGLSSDYDLLL